MDELVIEPAVAVAVFAVESGSKAFGHRQRLIIRFENHVFARQWGPQHRGEFDKHFRYNSEKHWVDQQFRARESDAWGDFHGSQTPEWRVFNFARDLNATASYRSISMGAPQIMGFNHSLVGYSSAKAMFEAFSKNIRPQLIGLFDFARRRDPRAVEALRRRDFFTFAGFYNGFGSPQPVYRDLLSAYYDAFPAARPADEVGPPETTYTVRSGDTLSGIASRFQSTVDALVALNGIANPNQLTVGTVLQIVPLVPPADDAPSGTPPAPSNGRNYTVRAGDSLAAIAAASNTTAAALASLNQITNPNLIQVGQVLRLTN